MESVTTPRTPTVMVVEDEQIVALDLQQMLGELGYEVVALASSADEAIAHAEQHRPDIVLMDIRIAGPQDGIETANVLHHRLGVPVVYLSAHSDRATLQRAKAAEPFGYLVKPVNPAHLATTLEVALHKHAEIGRQLRRLTRTLESVSQAAMRDELTGLLNRRGLAEQGGRAIEIARTTGRSLAIAYMDLNGMKAINDRLGHAAGDRLLRAFAKLLGEAFLVTDLTARLGGDEFVAVAVDYGEPDDGRALASRIQQRIVHARDPGAPHPLSASIGVAVFDPSQPCSFDELLRDADAKMYEAKNRRKLEGTQPIRRLV